MKNNVLAFIAGTALCGLSLIITACGSSASLEESSSSSRLSASSVSSSSSSSAAKVAARIKVNQLGFAPSAHKVAVVPAGSAITFTVIDTDTNAEAFRGELSGASLWPVAQEDVQLADFSALKTAGNYRVQVAGVASSGVFSIQAKPYQALNIKALKAYYFNRASTALEAQYAGDWARAEGHPDTQVKIHQSAATEARPAGTIVSAPKGWYDAGDYGKYVVNSGISTYTLLAALEQAPTFYAGEETNIPESGDAVPDILNEVMWNIDWLQAMQDPHDGGVYHKLTSKQFAGFVMPADANAQRYLMQKTTAATLDFAAVMAVASRVLADYKASFPGRSAQLLAASKSAFQWAKAHPHVEYVQPADVSTGAYGDNTFTDEFAWAGAELYITTGEDKYYRDIDAANTPISVPSWSNTAGLAWMSLATHLKDLDSAADKDLIRQRVIGLADQIVSAGKSSAYGVSMNASDFVWGSNGVAMNRAMMVLQAYRLSGKRAYVEAAQSLLDYVLGRNPTDYSFVTGVGDHSPMHIHHRQSQSDDVVAPVPGFLVGGPQNGKQDGCTYAASYPATTYLDDVCSYSTNEVTINWSAPLVYVSGALEALYEQ